MTIMSQLNIAAIPKKLHKIQHIIPKKLDYRLFQDYTANSSSHALTVKMCLQTKYDIFT